VCYSAGNGDKCICFAQVAGCLQVDMHRYWVWSNWLEIQSVEQVFTDKAHGVVMFSG